MTPAIDWWGAGMVSHLQRCADLHIAKLMPLLLTVSCFSKIQIGFTFLVPAHPGSPDKGPLNRCCCCILKANLRIIKNIKLKNRLKLTNNENSGITTTLVSTAIS